MPGQKEKYLAKLVVGLIGAKEPDLIKTEKIIKKKYGPIDFKSPVINFKYTDYYEKEFGINLKRLFLSFKKLISAEKLSNIKLNTIKIEKKFSKNGKRQVNIDPGYVTLSKLVLFTTKNYCHRIYLHKHIYAEITLKYEGNSFTAWPWTYPDYKTDEYIGYFNNVRNIYKKQLKKYAVNI